MTTKFSYTIAGRQVDRGSAIIHLIHYGYMMNVVSNMEFEVLLNDQWARHVEDVTVWRHEVEVA